MNTFHTHLTGCRPDGTLSYHTIIIQRQTKFAGKSRMACRRSKTLRRPACRMRTVNGCGSGEGSHSGTAEGATRAPPVGRTPISQAKGQSLKAGQSKCLSRRRVGRSPYGSAVFSHAACACNQKTMLFRAIPLGGVAFLFAAKREKRGIIV